MKRIGFFLGLAITGLCASVTASAATMPLRTAPLSEGSATVSSCDPDGFTASAFSTSGGKVTTITVGDIAADCQGGRLSVTLTTAGASVASGDSVTVTGTSQVVTLTGSPDAWTVDGFSAAIIGP